MNKTSGWIAAALAVIAWFCHMANADGISGTGIAFKSIVIDGVHYETTNALVRSNGIETTMDDLKVGHRVYALVDPDTLQALEIDQYDAVVGRVESVTELDETLNAYEFKVLNQTVRTSIETVMHVKKEFKVKKGDHVAVGGVRDATGVIWATSFEDSADKHDLILTGVVGEVGDYAFEIDGLWIESAYHYDYVQQGLLIPGAAVLVRGEKLDDGVLSANAVAPVPAELITLGEESFLSPAQSWVTGDIEWVDIDNRTLQVNGFEVDLDPRMLVLDKRDEVRGFDVELLQVLDPVEVVLQEEGSRLRAIKLVRRNKVKTRLRAPLQNWDDAAAAVTTLNRAFADVGEAEIKYRGKKLKLDDLREAIGEGDSLMLEWGKHGELKKLRVVSDSERWAGYRKRDKDQPSESVDQEDED